MCTSKYFKVFLVSCLIIILYYILYPTTNIVLHKSVIKHKFHTNSSQYKSTGQKADEEYSNYFLIDTPGCSIPDYSKTLRIKEGKYRKGSCGTRAVFIKKVSDEEIIFTINNDKMKPYTKGENYSCCYKFASPNVISGKEDYRKLRYSSCKGFKNNSNAELKKEVIVVSCILDSSKGRVIYDDAYVILKKLKREKKVKNPWNVLILGMDTMSRARAYSSLPQTVKYMLQNNWLDYRAYQKVGYNTFPNLMHLMTGKNMSTILKACSSGMDYCNDLIIWSEFKKAGYFTATGEEYLRLPDTFTKYKGFKSPPTDHYLRPLFMTGEFGRGNIICTKKTPSAKHILDYASVFAETYFTEENFFGMFWFNSYSHNSYNIPSLIDKDIVNFFSHLKETGVLQNTFIYFLSDHGIRNGKMREPYESYYEERLPMLFLWVPEPFQIDNEQEYEILKLNQNRLVTPYDLYLTFYGTITKSQTLTNVTSEACPGCTSIFNEVSIYRTCETAGIEEKWCTCHEMMNISQSNDDVVKATNLAVTDLQNTMRAIKSTRCMECEVLKLKKVFRTHMYRDEYRDKVYFVIAFVMSPGDVVFEVIVEKHNKIFSLILPIYSLSFYNTRGNCVVDQNDRPYCVCKKIEKCTKKH